MDSDNESWFHGGSPDPRGSECLVEVAPVAIGSPGAEVVSYLEYSNDKI